MRDTIRIRGKNAAIGTLFPDLPERSNPIQSVYHFCHASKIASAIDSFRHNL